MRFSAVVADDELRDEGVGFVVASDPDVTLKRVNDAVFLWMHIDVVHFLTVKIHPVHGDKSCFGVVEGHSASCETGDGFDCGVERASASDRLRRSVRSGLSL